ncbi:hypothetical protein [Haloarchaeobius sp. TZWWS8]|uniref:hypothetical protein n=1 Tax=Haloarchaeobius sp. TZWWS8 TaxID=3446121 RepID=UPI003EBE24D0
MNSADQPPADETVSADSDAIDLLDGWRAFISALAGATHAVVENPGDLGPFPLTVDALGDFLLFAVLLYLTFTVIAVLSSRIWG